jgi:uncharacterized membrane protein YczE
MSSRLLKLYSGLVLFGVSMALMLRARLGLDSWDVLHQGISLRTGLPFGWVVIAVGALVLLLWVPLRQRPGIGTVSNVIVVGLAVDAALDVLPAPAPMWARVTFLAVGILANSVATGLYIGAGLGPGPRDGLMTALAARGHSIRVVRTAIELTVLGAGWLLGGSVGAGTVVYALAIGPLAHYFIPRFAGRPTTSANGGSSGRTGSASDPAVPGSASPQPPTRTGCALHSTTGVGTAGRSSCPARA